MNYLEEWLASVEEHLNSVTAEEFEERYLAVRDGYGPTIEQYLSCWYEASYTAKSDLLTVENQKFHSMERVTVKTDKVPSVKQSFVINASNDCEYSMAA